MQAVNPPSQKWTGDLNQDWQLAYSLLTPGTLYNWGGGQLMLSADRNQMQYFPAKSSQGITLRKTDPVGYAASKNQGIADAFNAAYKTNFNTNCNWWEGLPLEYRASPAAWYPNSPTGMNPVFSKSNKNKISVNGDVSGLSELTSQGISPGSSPGGVSGYYNPGTYNPYPTYGNYGGGNQGVNYTFPSGEWGTYGPQGFVMPEFNVSQGGDYNTTPFYKTASNIGQSIPTIGNWTAEDVATYGLRMGATSLKDTLNRLPQMLYYPSFVPSEQNAPVALDYYQMSEPNAMQGLTSPEWVNMAGNAPTYTSLMSGDYEKLEEALKAPGETAARQAYDQALRDLQNYMGGRGLYGSSVMATKANEGLNRELLNALSTNASNAVVQRYNLQAQDLANLNTFLADIYGKDISRENAANQFGAQVFNTAIQHAFDLWRSDYANAELRNNYNLQNTLWNQAQIEAQREWANKQGIEGFQYELAKRAWEEQMYETFFNRAQALAGSGTPLATGYQNYNTAIQQLNALQSAASSASSASTWRSILNAIGQLGGGYLGYKLFTS